MVGAGDQARGRSGSPAICVATLSRDPGTPREEASEGDGDDAPRPAGTVKERELDLDRMLPRKGRRVSPRRGQAFSRRAGELLVDGNVPHGIRHAPCDMNGRASSPIPVWFGRKITVCQAPGWREEFPATAPE